MSETTVRLHAHVYGRVQGVNFRHYTQVEARRLGIVGWVTNRLDRSVEVVAEGKKENLEKLLNFLHQGPPSARVERTEHTWTEATGEFRNFRVKF